MQRMVIYRHDYEAFIRNNNFVCFFSRVANILGQNHPHSSLELCDDDDIDLDMDQESLDLDHSADMDPDDDML